MNGQTTDELQVVIVGGGMITHDQILPSMYHLQRSGRIGAIKVSALNSAPLRALAEEPCFEEAFPGQTFEPFPGLEGRSDKTFPELFKEVIASLPPDNMVVVAVPDHFHDPVIRCALQHDQHVLAVKPLVPTYAQSVEIDELARRKGLLVGVEYHKRFDRRSLDARRQYRLGRFVLFRCG